MSAPFKPSPFQAAIFEWVKTGSDNLIIRAVAGSGKSRTLTELLGFVPQTQRALVLAFNKSIATEMASKVPAHVQARTFHSLCYSPVTKALGVRSVDADKIHNLCRNHLTEEQGRLYGAFVKKMVGLARNSGIGCLIADTEEHWAAIAELHDLEPDAESATVEQGIWHARTILALSNKAMACDFDDLLYFAVLKGIRLPIYDWVLVDEAQDTNALQRAILRKLLAKGGRLIAVGDPAQSIYGFRGADSSAMPLIAEEFAPCVELPLSVTYRCATTIVEYAQDFVPDITAREGAPLGAVNSFGEDGWKLTDFGSHDIVVCRNTAPLIDLGYKLMRARIPLRILGKEIGEGLVKLIEKCGKNKGVDAMLAKLEVWADRECEKAYAKGNEGKAAQVLDKAEAIQMLADSLPENKRTCAELVEIIRSLFTDQNSRVTLCTVHKAKGLEADTVWWLGRSLCPSPWAKQEWQQEQERNIMYVAITRAKNTLNMIETEKTLKQRKQREAA